MYKRKNCPCDIDLITIMSAQPQQIIKYDPLITIGVHISTNVLNVKHDGRWLLIAP